MDMPIEWIRPHPKNPREELADIDDLVKSVKAHGIMQNLTVVPDFDENSGDTPSYVVIIGHRRLEAAKRAGLEKVPCTIARNLTDQDIQQIMLVENMQRTDLTPLEEAKGIQMCLDLGIPESALAEKTGFSRNTIKARKTLLKFTEENVRNAFNTGATLQDFMDLDKIEDPEIRDDLLKNSIGTKFFRRDLDIAKRRDETKRWLNKKALPYLEKHNAEKLESRDGDWQHASYFFNGREDFDSVFPKDLDPDDKIGYTVGSYGVDIFVKYAHPKPKQEAQEDERQKRRRLLADEFTRARVRRTDFIKDLRWMPVNQHEAKKELLSEIVEFMCGWHSTELDMQLFREIFDPSKKSWKADDAAEKIRNLYDQNPVKALITVVYMIREKQAGESYDWNGRYAGGKIEGNKKMYEFLEQFGFVMTPEERQLIDGTHQLYAEPAE